jgi:hypothetical protein
VTIHEDTRNYSNQGIPFAPVRVISRIAFGFMPSCWGRLPWLRAPAADPLQFFERAFVLLELLAGFAEFSL